MSTPAEWVTERRVVVKDDPAEVADAIGRRLVRKLVNWTGRGRPVHISLTGGSTGIASLRAAASHPGNGDVDWTRVHFWWGDERFVPRADSERNALQARDALLDRVPVPPGNIHEMGASDEGMDLDAAAGAYARELVRFGSAAQPWPVFDLCLLGVGPDGHIASLFPDRPEIRITDAAVVPVRESPKPPPERISLTRPVINSSQRVWLGLTGADKASALGLILAGASYASVPAAGAKGLRRTFAFVDRAAAAQAPPELIERD